MNKLEKATYWLMIATCAISLGLLIERRLSQQRVTSLPTAKELTGRAISLPGVHWNSSSMNVVLQLNSQCHYCQESSRLYQQITTLRRGKPGLAFFVTSNEPVDNITKYLAKESIVADAVFQSTLDSVAFNGTPAIFIADGTGVIRRAFLGKLNQSAERNLLQLLERGSI